MWQKCAFLTKKTFIWNPKQPVNCQPNDAKRRGTTPKRRETTRNARSALDARRGLKLERRARTCGRSHGRKGRKERSERDSIHERQKILGEFYHKKTINKKRVETRRAYKKNWAPKKYAFKRASPNERKATRTPCRHPKMTRIRRERADTRGRIRTHASILVYRPMYNEYFLKRTSHTYTTSPCKRVKKLTTRWVSPRSSKIFQKR